MQNVLPRSGARAYTVSDDASADQRYRPLSRRLDRRDRVIQNEGDDSIGGKV